MAEIGYPVLAGKTGLAAEGIMEVLGRFSGSSGVIRGAARIEE